MQNRKISVFLSLLFLVFSVTACKQAVSPTPIRFTGKIEAARYTITAVKDGEIRGLILEKGERIRKGQPLFGLGTQDTDPAADQAAAELAKAQAELNRNSAATGAAARAAAAANLQNSLSEVQNARQAYNKMQQLYAIGGISRARLQQSQTNLDQATASLNAARAQLERSSQIQSPEEAEAQRKKVQELKDAYEKSVLAVAGSEVSSPTTGIVREIWVGNGTKVKQQQKVMEILSSTDCSISISLPTTDSRLKEGMTVTLRSTSLKKSFPGLLRKIEGNTVTVFSDRKPEDLPDGAAVEVLIEQPETAS